ncbi:MAG: hypothetical protein IJV72_08640 [Clostridia bacterium]|nr:hypothetical protein [Clostridia bacterium]
MTYESIVKELLREADNILSVTEKFLTFPEKNQVVMSASDEDIKKAYMRYRRFTVKLLERLGEADKIAAELSALVCRADADRNTDELSRASLLLDRFLAWRHSLSDFMSANDLLFTKNKNDFRYSTLISNTQKFYESTKFLKGNLK